MEISKEDKKKIKELEKRFGYSFKNKDHLRRALTHRSYANEHSLDHTEHNERYEYLGDAVLELAISHLLMMAFQDQPEGELSKLRAAIVNEQQLAMLARAVNLGDYLFLGKGEEQTGGRDKPSLLADCFEAVLGGIYLDRGFIKAHDVIEKHVRSILRTARQPGGLVRDFKTKLQEESQKRYKSVPKYKLVKEYGPDHDKTFKVKLYIKDNVFGEGVGSSKKAAEQEAAKHALEQMGCL